MKIGIVGMPNAGKSSLFNALTRAGAQAANAQDVLRDSETELFFKDVARPLEVAAKLDPKSVNIVLLNDPEINAFVAGGQVVYINSGLLMAADNANQMQGVIAHELGHVAGAVAALGEAQRVAVGLDGLADEGAFGIERAQAKVGLRHVRLNEQPRALHQGFT